MLQPSDWQQSQITHSMTTEFKHSSKYGKVTLIRINSLNLETMTSHCASSRCNISVYDIFHFDNQFSITVTETIKFLKYLLLIYFLVVTST